MNIARNLEIYYSNYNLLYTTDSNSNMTSSNILNLEGNVISSTRNDNNFYAYNKDSRNSTSSIVDKNNNGVVTYKYSDFGETEQLGNQEFDNEICYTGGIYDKETGEYYLNARHYDPSIARFTSVDTYRGETEEPLSLHLYAYCANNPINFVDPSGHWPLEIGHFKGSMSYNSRYAWLKIKITHTRRGKIYRIVMTWGNLIVSCAKERTKYYSGLLGSGKKTVIMYKDVDRPKSGHEHYAVYQGGGFIYKRGKIWRYFRTGKLKTHYV